MGDSRLRALSRGIFVSTASCTVYLKTKHHLFVSSPPSMPSLDEIQVTNNAGVGGRSVVSSTFSRSGISFQYEDAPKINNVFPYLGPASGNFSVRIAGGPFPDTPELRYCGN